MVFGLLICINEYCIKAILKFQRPSHIYLLKESNSETTIDSIYQLNRKDQKKYFEILIQQNKDNFKNIDPKIQNHWIDEVGFSFPSGHSFNAFLFAMIVAYSIYFNNYKIRLRKLFFMPFI